MRWRPRGRSRSRRARADRRRQPRRRQGQRHRGDRRRRALRRAGGPRTHLRAPAVAGGWNRGLGRAAGAAAGVWWQRAHTPPPMVPQPRVLVVGGTTPGAYPTIAAALAAARPGDTVDVLGEYREPVALKSGVTLRSRVPREAVLLAPVGAQEVRGAKLIGFSIRLGRSCAGRRGGLPRTLGGRARRQRSRACRDWRSRSSAARPAVLLGNAIHDCGGRRADHRSARAVAFAQFLPAEQRSGWWRVDGARPL